MGQSYDLIGPPLQNGCHQTILYFALSKKESFFVDPYNQPIEPWKEGNFRIISFDLPFHGEGLDSHRGMDAWQDTFKSVGDPLTPFLDQVEDFIRHFLKEELEQSKIGLAGLSRGAFIALNLSRRFSTSLPIVSFAPLLSLERSKEFSTLTPSLVKEFHPILHIDKICQHRFLFTIGNNDTRVHTEETICLVEALIALAKEKKIRQIPIELHMHLSIGMYGHGTPKKVFLEGARWLIDQLQ